METLDLLTQIGFVEEELGDPEAGPA
jgi:hypothetical protein